MFEPAPEVFPPPENRENRPFSPMYRTFPPHVRAFVCEARDFVHRVFFGTAPPLRITVLAAAVFFAIVIVASAAGSEIDLTKFLPGNTATTGRPQIVVVDGRLTNQGDGPALNLEVTRPRYQLIGTLAASEGTAIPASDFAVQYEWKEGDNTHRESKSFKIGNGVVAGHTGVTSPAPNQFTPSVATLDSGVIPRGLAACYDPATHLLTITADHPVEVRVDGFLLRPISRTDKDGAQYRYAQANLLVLGQDLKQGDTVTFEVVFTKPQDYYSIPLYVRELGKPATYLTVSVSTQEHVL